MKARRARGGHARLVIIRTFTILLAISALIVNVLRGRKNHLPKIKITCGNVNIVKRLM